MYLYKRNSGLPEIHNRNATNARYADEYSNNTASIHQ